MIKSSANIPKILMGTKANGKFPAKLRLLGKFSVELKLAAVKIWCGTKVG